uniref:UDP-glycosyltransferase 1 n=1 Tax=Linum usitatissimum TaxID=4006 RepID=I2BH40_LINUS|nr:UDP-glycosyltransferase 1 [Linum usitatissimum]
MATETTPQPHPLHFVLIPFMAQGHLLPMTDIAKLFARHGVLVTFITTPVNAGRVRATLARAVADSPAVQIRVEEVEFPCEEEEEGGGDGLLLLPKHCETLDRLPSLGLGSNFFYSTDSLRKPVEKLFEGLRPNPSCVVSDICLPFTAHVAEKFGVPRITFNGFSTFTLLCLRYIHDKNVMGVVGRDSEPFVVPGIPDRVELTKNQLPLSMTDGLDRFGEQIMVAEALSYGMIVNSFEELDPEYVEKYKVAMGGKAWCVGPVSLVNESQLDRLQRGNNAQYATGESKCLNWLDSRKSGSIIYVCLGSICNIPTRQLIELALGLEASNVPFMWVIRDRGEASKELWEWMNEYDFEEKTKERGFLIQGWAPQMVILAHQAVGGFLTHCGWNSTLEGICAGVAMLTWPLFGDQFCNERLVVDVLKIGIGIGANNTVKWGEEDKVGVLVKKENVKKGIDEVMSEGEEGDMRRRRVKELSGKSKLALLEGGSSYVNIERLKQDILEQTSIKLFTRH